MRRQVSVRNLSAATALAALMVSPALAQTLELPELIVQGAPSNGLDRYIATSDSTSTKTNTALIETPFSVSTVTEAETRERGARNLAESLNRTPGVMAEFQVQNAVFDRTRLRGFYHSANVYLDGLYLAPSGTIAVPQIDLVHISRVEALRGPSSGLYGQNSAGGMINMSSKLPPAERFGEVGAIFGNYEQLKGYFDVGGPVNQERTLLYRLSGQAQMRETDIYGHEIKNLSIAPAVTWRPDNMTSLTVLGGYRKDDAGPISSFIPISGTVAPNIYGKISRRLNPGDPEFDSYDRSIAYVGTILEHKFNDNLQFRQTTRLIQTEVDYNSLRPAAMKADQRTYSRNALTASAKLQGAAIDNSILYKFDTGPLKHQLIAGLDARQFNHKNRTNQASSSSLDFDVFAPRYGNLRIPALPNTQNDDMTVSQTGIYVQDQISIGRLRLTGSLRQDWARNDAKNLRSGERNVYNSDKLTGRAGAVYLFDNGFAPFINYSTSFEPLTSVDYFGTPLKPTEGTQWEAGIRYQPTNFDGLFSLTAFDLTQNNVATADLAHTCAVVPAVPRCGSYSIQTGQIRVKGIEFEAKASLLDGLNAIVSYTYMNGEVTRSNGTDLNKVPVNLPTHMGSGWLTYKFGKSSPVGGLTIGGGARAVGPMWANSTNTLKIPGYVLWDAMLRYDFEDRFPDMRGVSLQVNATNLADSKAVAGCWSQSFCDYVHGRTVTATLSKRF